MQEQASPPSIHQGGAWTICCIWATFVRGYERRRPTCTPCLRACEQDEGIAAPSSPSTLATTPDASAAKVVPLKTAPASGPPQMVAAPQAPTTTTTPKAVQDRRDALLAEEAAFNARLDALVTATKQRQRR